MNFKMRGYSENFKVTVVHVRCSALVRLEFWNDLEEVARNSQYPWLVGGDFNIILFD